MKVTPHQAILLQCHECLGYYRDGKSDCGVQHCPLYTWMPYRKLEPILTCFEYSPRHVGKVLLSDIYSRVTDKQREASRKNMEKMKQKGRDTSNE